MLILIRLLFQQAKPKKITPKEQLDQFIYETIFNDDHLTQKEIENKLGVPISNELFLFGHDSYLSDQIDADIINKYHLKNYLKKQRSYIESIKKEFKERFNFKVEERIEKDYNYFDYHIVTFYYGMYISDLDELISYGVKQKNINLDILEKSEKLQIDYYKVKVRAMEILNNHLEVYKNKENEPIEVTIIFKDGKPENKDELFSLFCNIYGLTYSNATPDDPEIIKIEKNRLKEYKAELKEKLVN